MRTLFVVGMLALATPLFAKGKTEVIAAPYQEVWTATIAVAAEEFTISFASKADGVIAFWNDKDIKCAVLIAPASGASTSLTFNQSDGENQGRDRITKGVKERLGK